MAKMWTSGGEEQKHLEKLFREKKSQLCYDCALTVQNQYPLFQGFSAAVFRKHWNLTKQMFNTSKLSKNYIVSFYVQILMF